MKVSDIEGNQMQVTWDSVDENGAAKTYEGAAALEQAAADIGETSIVSRTGGATTFAMGMANFLKPTWAATTRWPSGTTSPSCSKPCSS